MSRSASGDAIDGVKVVIYDNLGSNTEVLDIPYSIAQLETVVKPANATNGINQSEISKIEVTPYFQDESGTDQLCPITSTKTF